MTEYRDVRRDWFALLHFHLKVHGTRPHLGTTQGKPWGDAEFARACGRGDVLRPDYAARTVQYWYQLDDTKRQVVAPDIKSIEAALMGENSAFDSPTSTWRNDLRVAHNLARQKKGVPSAQTSFAKDLVQFDSTVDQTSNSKAFGLVMSEGVLIKLRGAIQITAGFFSSIYETCCNLQFIKMVIDTKFGSDTIYEPRWWIVQAIIQWSKGSGEWRFDRVVFEEAVLHVDAIFSNKAVEVGLLSRSGEHFLSCSSEASSAFWNIWLGRISRRRLSGPEIYSEAFESWKDVAQAAVNTLPGEDPRYAAILAVFIFGRASDKLADAARHVGENHELIFPRLGGPGE